MKTNYKKITLDNVEEITKKFFKNESGRKVVPYRKYGTLDALMNHVQDNYEYYRNLSSLEKEKAYNEFKQELSYLVGWHSAKNFNQKLFNMSLGRIGALIEH